MASGTNDGSTYAWAIETTLVATKFFCSSVVLSRMHSRKLSLVIFCRVIVIDVLPSIRRPSALPSQPVARGDDLGDDADGDLVGGVGADGQADRGVQAGELFFGHAILAQARQPLRVGPGAAERADVAGWAGQRDLERGVVELGVVRQQHDE